MGSLRKSVRESGRENSVRALRPQLSRGHDRIQNLEKLSHPSARHDDGIPSTVGLLADPQKTPPGVLAIIHGEMLAFHLELAAGDDGFHVHFAQRSEQEKRSREKEPRLMPQ